MSRLHQERTSDRPFPLFSHVSLFSLASQIATLSLIQLDLFVFSEAAMNTKTKGFWTSHYYTFLLSHLPGCVSQRLRISALAERGEAGKARREGPGNEDVRGCPALTSASPSEPGVKLARSVGRGRYSWDACSSVVSIGRRRNGS